MKILVCGGRDFSDYQYMSEVLNDYYEVLKLLIHGGANGADKLSGLWARSNGVQEVVCPANWDRLGKVAGAIRNSNMTLLEPDLCIAFPGGSGTQHMIDTCEMKNIAYIKVGV